MRSRLFRNLILGGSLPVDDLTAVPSLFEDVADLGKPAQLPDMTSSEVAEDFFVTKLYRLCLAALAATNGAKHALKQLETSSESLARACASYCSTQSSIAQSIFSKTTVDGRAWHTHLRWEVFHSLHQQSYLYDLLAGSVHFLCLVVRRSPPGLEASLSALEQALRSVETAAHDFHKAARRWASTLKVELRQSETIEHLVGALSRGKESDEVAAELSAPDEEGRQLLDGREFAVNLANGWVDSLEAFASQRS